MKGRIFGGKNKQKQKTKKKKVAEHKIRVLIFSTTFV